MRERERIHTGQQEKEERETSPHALYHCSSITLMCLIWLRHFDGGRNRDRPCKAKGLAWAFDMMQSSLCQIHTWCFSISSTSLSPWSNAIKTTRSTTPSKTPVVYLLDDQQTQWNKILSVDKSVLEMALVHQYVTVSTLQKHF